MDVLGSAALAEGGTFGSLGVKRMGMAQHVQIIPTTLNYNESVVYKSWKILMFPICCLPSMVPSRLMELGEA